MQEGKRPIEEPTVFYMIHCGKALYNNLLWSNWSAEALSKMVIIGNSFKGIEERYPLQLILLGVGFPHSPLKFFLDFETESLLGS